MTNELFALIKEYGSVSISGMCKNAGKTTTLNTLIKSIPDYETPALSSIGRDGEKVDLVTGTHKPGIFISKGTIIATAERLLKNCDITKEILDTTGISTPMGEVIILRALSDGNVELAGPSIVSQLIEVSNTFRVFGADRIIIDGAVGRRSLCSRSLSEAVILCTGASFSPVMEETVTETAHVCELLMTKSLPDEILCAPESSLSALGLQNLSEASSNKPESPLGAPESSLKENSGILHFEGAVTDNLLDPLIRSGKCNELTIVAQDASKLLISINTLRRLKAVGAKLAVAQETHLAAITVNPFSAYGNHYNAAEFISKMQAAASVPVINVSYIV